jgi:hypothetical protein
MNVFTDYADTHWIPIDGNTVTVQTVDAEGNRQTHVLSVAEAVAQFKVKYPFVADEAVTELFTRAG